MNSDEQPDARPSAELPPALRQAMQRLLRQQAIIPPRVDRAVRQAAAAHLRRSAEALPPRARMRLPCAWRNALAAVSWRPILPWLGAAAAFVLALWLARPVWLPQPPALAGDFNRDGMLDILDAFALAREVKLRPSENRRFDLNRDGRVDHADAQTIAQHAVALDHGKDSL